MEDFKTIASHELLMEQLSNRDWDKFWLRLMGRCAWILRKRYGVKWKNDELQSFSRDVISEVVNQIFVKGSRNWNIDHYIDFEDFIIGAIDSHINNTLNKAVKETEFDEKKTLSDEDPIGVNIEQIIIGKELKEQIFEVLQESGAKEDELFIFECLAEGIVKPEEIRTTIGLSEEEFHNAWRRFKRKREIIKQKLAAK
jgi:hypothetical protein